MRVITMIIGVFSLLVGLYYGSTSLSVQTMTGEHAATLACAAFLFVIALGVWSNGSEDEVHQKRMQEMTKELIRRQGVPPQPEQPAHPDQMYQRPQ